VLCHKSGSESSWELIREDGWSCKAKHLIKGQGDRLQLSCFQSCSQNLY